jgi:hypothetical protein
VDAGVGHGFNVLVRGHGQAEIRKSRTLRRVRRHSLATVKRKLEFYFNLHT